MIHPEICPSRFKNWGDVFPCQLKTGHKGKHKFQLSWTDKEAAISGRIKQ